VNRSSLTDGNKYSLYYILKSVEDNVSSDELFIAVALRSILT
jgi:hypothetical protein